MLIKQSKKYFSYLVGSWLLFSCAWLNAASLPHPQPSQAVGFSAGWISGSGITYRRYLGNNFIQGTFFGMFGDSGSNMYVNGALSAGRYLHRRKAWGLLPPHGIHVLLGADYAVQRENSQDPFASDYEKSFYGAGIGLDFGNPGEKGLNLWLSILYVASYEGIGSAAFESFGMRPASGIFYAW
ncbi:MAG: hypothetical protein OEZ58_04610 [Gammaproteobacteria bacterium]|nr:hypothetical protein [Gammaproteobacteria bacterium]MDH5728246.1 hypothetical protein [Gammaproteobacteria bacterium]